MEIIDTFVRRLSKIGIEVKLISNVPWVYLYTVNGKFVEEKYEAEHGFTAFWVPVSNKYPCRMSNIKEVFKIIRKYR